MELTRQTFLIGLGSLLAVPGVGDAVVATPALHTLHGDGVHDDAPALNSLLSGGIAQDLKGEVFRSPLIRGGLFRVREVITVSVDDAVILRSDFIVDHDGDGLVLASGNTLIGHCTWAKVLKKEGGIDNAAGKG